jgi:hypothetical protein
VSSQNIFTSFFVYCDYIILRIRKSTVFVILVVILTYSVVFFGLLFSLC